MHAAGYTAYAQQAQANQPPTQQTWQHQTGAVGSNTMEQRRSGSALFAILGVVAGPFFPATTGGAAATGGGGAACPPSPWRGRADAARQVKNMTCTAASSSSPNSGSSNCDRVNCRRACTILNDTSCILQLDNAERGNPLKF